MKYIRTLGEVGFISALSLFGQGLSSFFHLPLPGNRVGMFLLLFLLFSGLVKEAQIQKGADLLLKYMSLFFIPAGVQFFFGLFEGLIQSFIIALLTLTYTGLITNTSHEEA